MSTAADRQRRRRDRLRAGRVMLQIEIDRAALEQNNIDAILNAVLSAARLPVTRDRRTQNHDERDHLGLLFTQLAALLPPAEDLGRAVWVELALYTAGPWRLDKALPENPYAHGTTQAALFQIMQANHGDVPDLPSIRRGLLNGGLSNS
jgi:hypothetical protein